MQGDMMYENETDLTEYRPDAKFLFLGGSSPQKPKVSNYKNGLRKP